MTARYALITGASSGIGAAMAELAAHRGFNLGLVARRRDRLEGLATKLRALGRTADVLPEDLAETGCDAALCHKLEALGRSVDVLVNNAGATLPRSFMGTSLDDHRAFMALTMTTPVALTHQLLPGMLVRGWGRIITISSLAALSSGGRGNTLYPAGKSFLLKFSQSLNAEVKAKGVHVSAVLPGFVLTEFQAANGIPQTAGGSTRSMAQSAEEVAQEAWDRNEQGHEIIVPGLPPKLAAAFMRFLPEPIMRHLTRAAAAPYYVGD